LADADLLKLTDGDHTSTMRHLKSKTPQEWSTNEKLRNACETYEISKQRLPLTWALMKRINRQVILEVDLACQASESSVMSVRVRAHLALRTVFKRGSIANIQSADHWDQKEWYAAHKQTERYNAYLEKQKCIIS